MPNSSPKTSLGIVVLLCLVFAGLVGGYIYLGMWQASQNSQVENIPSVEPVDKRQEILDALANAPAPDPARREEVLGALEQNTQDSPIPDDKRAEILNALAPVPSPVTVE
jgi:hypothetical protein